MNKTVFLFVGPHRSGSTFLLGQIFPHVRNLCNMRSHDPACSDVVMEAMDEHPMFIDIDAYRERIYSRFDSIEEDNVLIGNEEFFGDYGKYISDGAYVAKPFYDNPQRVDLLAKLFDNPKIILTPRRQDLWVESAYMHFVHNSHTITVDEFLSPGMAWGTSEFRTRSEKPSMDYRTLDWSRYVQNYQRVFGRENVVVLPHEMILHDLNDALARLYEFMGVEPYYPEKVAYVNRSYSASAHRIALLLNRFVRQGSYCSSCGIFPTQPFLGEIQRKREVKDTRWLWFLAGISRRISLHWFLGQFLGKFNYKKPDILGSEFRTQILDFYRQKNKAYAELIGMDLAKYGYY